MQPENIRLLTLLMGAIDKTYMGTHEGHARMMIRRTEHSAAVHATIVTAKNFTRLSMAFLDISRLLNVALLVRSHVS